MPHRCLRFTLLSALGLVLICSNDAPVAAQNNGPTSPPVVGQGAPAQAIKAAISEWPQWRGPRRDGVSTETGLLKEWPKEGPPLLWNSVKVNDGQGLGAGMSSVVVAGGKLFTMGDLQGQTHVFCLNAETGKILWKSKIGPGTGGSGPAGPRCSPTVDGDRLYALTRHGVLACLSTGDGEIKWKVDYMKDLGGRMMSGWGYSESPLVDGDLVIGTPGSDTAALAAFNKHTGAVVWKTALKKCGGSGYSSIVVAEVGGIRQYITLLGRGLVSVHAKDGQLLWDYPRIAGGTAHIPTAVVKGDLVFATTGYDRGGSALLQIIPVNGSCKAQEVYYYNNKELQNHHGGVVLVGEYLYGGHGHNNGRPFCLHLATGKIVWGPMPRGAGSGSAAVVYADSHLYFRWQDGTIGLVEATPEGYRLKSAFRQPNRSRDPAWPHPVVVDGRLYIRDVDVLLCYDVRQK